MFGACLSLALGLGKRKGLPRNIVFAGQAFYQLSISTSSLREAFGQGLLEQFFKSAPASFLFEELHQL